ncbi:5-hydroxytryptamine receptor 3A-like [Melospiza georgiana]|uniref:5-hydroxytryptamine receptor 3A-like n=1 Tax=Melospiza georgiana TaxID=44398 RepID=UPI0025AB621B|nr:5-hydroxytryptamine receptor 3A-like [Melospiza georgiana]
MGRAEIPAQRPRPRELAGPVWGAVKPRTRPGPRGGGAGRRARHSCCGRVDKAVVLYGEVSEKIDAGAAPKYLCTYYDIVDYLNISSHDKLHTYILPKINLKEPVEVKVDFFLVSILSVVEKLQTVSFYFVLNLEWQNPFATWDPWDFCNISEIVLPMDTYWSPPIFILERVNGQDPELNYVVLMHNGTFNSTRPYQVTLTCSLVIFKFPFDTQMCNLSIASFLYPVTDFVMKTRRTPAEIVRDSKSLILTDGEWKFTNVSIMEFTEMMDDKEFSVVTYVISMDRRPTLYILNLILPTCALYLLDMAVLFGPSSLEEKINFQIAIILGSSMLAVILNNSLPTSSNKPPIIVVFFLGTFLLMIMAVLDTFFLLYQQRKSGRLDKVLRSFQQDPHQLPKAPPDNLAKGGPQLLHPPKMAQGQPTKRLWQLQELDQFLPVLEKVLLFSHLFLSLFFFAVIFVKWSS